MSHATKAIQLEMFEDPELGSSFQVMDGQSRICNWLFNHLLELADQLRKQARESGDFESAKSVYTKRGLRNWIPDLKEQFPFLRSVHSSPLKNAALRLSAAIREHQKGKKGEWKRQTGWPGFRSWKQRWFSLLYDEPNKGYKLEGNVITFSLGVNEKEERLKASFRLREASVLKGYEIRNVRVTRCNGRMYAIFTVEVPLPEKKPVNTFIALDPNHKNLAYGVDHEGSAVEIEAPYWLKKHDKKLDELKSRRDRCRKKSKKLAVLDSRHQPTGKEYYVPSRQWLKRHQVYERELHRSREQKKTYMYTVSHKLFRHYDGVAIGDYTPRGGGKSRKMSRSMNNRSLIGKFKEVLHWVATKLGKTMWVYDEKGTTRTCHACGYVVPEGLEPSIRAWRCPCCHFEHCRDENAAIHGHRRILRDLQQTGEVNSSVPSSGPVFIRKRCAWRVLPSGVISTLRGLEQRVRLAAPSN